MSVLAQWLLSKGVFASQLEFELQRGLTYEARDWSE